MIVKIDKRRKCLKASYELLQGFMIESMSSLLFWRENRSSITEISSIGTSDILTHQGLFLSYYYNSFSSSTKILSNDYLLPKRGKRKHLFLTLSLSPSLSLLLPFPPSTTLNILPLFSSIHMTCQNVTYKRCWFILRKFFVTFGN